MTSALHFTLTLPFTTLKVYYWSDAEYTGMTDNRGPLKSAEKVQTSANDTVLTLIALKSSTRYTICIEAENGGKHKRSMGTVYG